MKAYFAWGSQEIPEVDTLEEIRSNGLYSVIGFENPVSVAEATPCGESELSERFSDMLFFWGNDGKRRYAHMTGSYKPF